MKYYELKQIAKYLNNFKKIFAIERVEDTVIKFIFDRHKAIYADLKKGNSTFFMADDFLKQKIYNAPFDVLLNKYFTNSYIKNVEVEKDNRILKISVNSSTKYKQDDFTLWLEFTGRNTNAIILNRDKKILEALRHIQKNRSFRVVSVGETLLALPPFHFKESEKIIEDIPSFLHEVYEKQKENHIKILKINKISQIDKKLKKLSDEFEKLPSERSLKEKSSKLNKNATLILANLFQIKPYEKEVEIFDFDGQKRVIELPKGGLSPQNSANILFEKSKKLKQKASSIHIQKDNLKDKINFYKRLADMINSTKSASEINILFPKQQNRQKKEQKRVSYESFFIQDYKIFVGKSQKSNIELFKEAKKRDIWLHVKDIPSSHVIIRTKKQNLPFDILEFSAKLCVNFSTTKVGSFLVDYTMWQNVRIDIGSNVFYTDYKTIKINKE